MPQTGIAARREVIKSGPSRTEKARSFRVRKTFSRNGRAIFYHGDAKTFLAKLPSASIHLVVTSPPYNIGKPYEKRASIADYLRQQEDVIKELVRVLRKDGSICWQVGTFVHQGEIYPLDILFYELFKKWGLQLRNRIVWHYRHGLHAEKRFSGRYETILWFTKSDNFVFNLDAVRVPSRYPGKRHYKGPRKGKPSGNPLGKNPSDVWEIIRSDWKSSWWDIPNVKANHPEKTMQPCQFPVELVERCVLALTKRGDRVLDPYGGVASALVGALKHGRRALGSEKKKRYYDIGVKRLNALKKGQLALRALGTPIYVPTGREKVAIIPREWNAISIYSGKRSKRA